MFLPNSMAALRVLASNWQIDEEVTAVLLSKVDDAQATLDRGHDRTAIAILNEMIIQVIALVDDTETAQFGVK